MNKYALVCDDNLTSAYCIKAMFEKLGYKIDIAQSAQETLEYLSKNTYDLLTLDRLLPDKNGLELLKEIKSNEATKNLPVIIISATPKDEEAAEYENDFVYWVEKSFDLGGFEEALESINKDTEARKLEVLHVENDEDLLNLIDITLSDIANVTKANNLTKAKQLIETQPFDIIILDYVFPEGTSDKLLPSIKSGVNKNAKLIMFSAYEENKIISRYFDATIMKTKISFTEFKDCIEKFIPNKSKTAN